MGELGTDVLQQFPPKPAGLGGTCNAASNRLGIGRGNNLREHHITYSVLPYQEKLTAA